MSGEPLTLDEYCFLQDALDRYVCDLQDLYDPRDPDTAAVNAEHRAIAQSIRDKVAIN
jgi:hypothetical protein